MNEFYINILIIVLGVIGSVVSFCIYKKESKHHPLTCPIGECDQVVASKYGKTMGIPNSISGMLYYDFISTVYFVLVVWPGLFDFEYGDTFFLFIKLATLGAFLFSVFLTIVQAFIIKKWCFWCVISAIISTAIFILVTIF